MRQLTISSGLLRSYIATWKNVELSLCVPLTTLREMPELTYVQQEGYN